MFTAVDIFFVVIILIFALTSAARGFVKEFFGKASIILGIALAIIFYGKLFPYVFPYVKNLLLSKVISFLIIFIIVYLLIKIIQNLVAKVFSSEIMGGLNHSLGFLWGIAEGVTVVALLIILMRGQPWIDFSRLLGGSFFYRVLSSIISVPTQYMKGMFA